MRVGDRFRLDRPVEVLRVPDSLRGLLDARVDRLADVEKDVLQAASVVGTHGAGGPAAQGRAARRRRARPGAGAALRRRVPGPGRHRGAAAAAQRYAFRHGLIREAAYNGILLRSRVRMHGAVLDALEQRGGGEADADLLADHATQAEAWPKAVGYSQRRRARGRSTATPTRSRARYYQQALAAAEHLAGRCRRRSARCSACTSACAGRCSGWATCATCARIWTRRPRWPARHDDHEQLGQSHALRSHVLWLAGKPDEAEAAAEAARAHRQRARRPRPRAPGQFQSALVHLTSGRIPEIVAALEEVLDHIGRRRPGPAATGSTRTWR